MCIGHFVSQTVYWSYFLLTLYDEVLGKTFMVLPFFTYGTGHLAPFVGKLQIYEIYECKSDWLCEYRSVNISCPAKYAKYAQSNKLMGKLLRILE